MSYSKQKKGDLREISPPFHLVEYRLDLGAWLRASANDNLFDEAEERFILTIPSLTLGTHIVEARGMNSAGNVNQQVAQYTIIMDDQIPTVTITYPRDGSEIRSSSLIFQWSGLDEISGISHYEVRLDQSS